MDEAGRGCLAGPVVAAAVVFDQRRPVSGLRDSKLLTPAARERLYERIVANAEWTVASVGSVEIDRVNIHQASLDAMGRAVSAFLLPPDFVLVDGFQIPGLVVPQRGIVHGDRRCTAIAAASIVAKVTRDRQMRRLHKKDPRYGFDRHKGYATSSHIAAVRRFGYSAVHRHSFRPRSLFDRVP